MWKIITFTILVFGVVVSKSEDIVEPEQCNGPPPFRMNPDDCCKKPIFKTKLSDCLNKTRQLIVQKYRGGESEKQDDGQSSGDETCLGNCFSDTKIFGEDGINRDELIAVLAANTEDNAWSDIHSIAVDKCMDILRPQFEDIKSEKWIQKCNRLAVRMILCLNGQYFVNCPETHFETKDDKCKAFQEHVKICPLPKGHHGPGGWKGPGGHFAGRRGPGHGFGGPGKGFGGPGQGFGGPGEGFGGPPGHFSPEHSFGKRPNFGTGEAFGFL